MTLQKVELEMEMDKKDPKYEEIPIEVAIMPGEKKKIDFKDCSEVYFSSATLGETNQAMNGQKIKLFVNFDSYYLDSDDSDSASPRTAGEIVEIMEFTAGATPNRSPIELIFANQMNPVFYTNGNVVIKLSGFLYQPCDTENDECTSIPDQKEKVEIDVPKDVTLLIQAN